ncbi:MAG: hypothetical protein QM760_01190, partial [Nibricoccus sp.]
LINSTVEAGRKGAFLERNRVRLAERFQWALAPALLFLAWSYWREFPVRPRPRDIQLKSTTPSVASPSSRSHTHRHPHRSPLHSFTLHSSPVTLRCGCIRSGSLRHHRRSA